MTGAATTGAIVFTDIVGFTEFTAEQGDTEALAMLDRQDRLVRSALPERARIVKELGDGLLLWFPEAGPALETCLGLLDVFTDVPDDASPLWVRMGMHWGCPTPRGNDLVGHAVNLTARIVDVAGPGELLVSERRTRRGRRAGRCRRLRRAGSRRDARDPRPGPALSRVANAHLDGVSPVIRPVGRSARSRARSGAPPCRRTRPLRRSAGASALA